MVLLLAFSLQDQVDKYGVYIGIAAFLGLAVLSLLYFAQARELKRLRDWAGRAPERARELEERVTAQAQQPPAAQRPLPAPLPPAARPAASAAAATAAGGAVAVAAPPKPPVEKAGLAEGNGAGDGPPDGDELPDAAPEPAASARRAVKEPEAEMPSATEEEAAPEKDAEAPDATDGDGDGEVRPEAAASKADAAEPGEDDKEPVANGNGSGDAAATPPRPSFPRPSTAAAAAGAAGAAPRPPAPPRPAPAAQRRPAAALSSSTPSATTGPRRSVPLPPRRPAPPPPEHEGRSRGTWAVVGGVAAVFIAAGVFVYTQVSGTEEPNRPAGQASTPTPTPTPADDGGGSGGSPSSRADTNVAVFNGTTQTGLAGIVADKVSAGGFKRGATGNDTNQQRSTSLVFYTPEARAAAREVAKLLKISETRPIDTETQALAGGNADVVVVAGLDQAP